MPKKDREAATMSYENRFLMDFKPVYLGILYAKQIPPKSAELEIIDEDADCIRIFEPADAKSVLEQLETELNFLTIYTDRAAYFKECAETMYEENGLIVKIFSKRCLRGLVKKDNTSISTKIVLDFEWQGKCYEQQICQGKHYIPIYKKPWQMAENLDIAVPIGYNTVIVKRPQRMVKKMCRDRIEAAFYNS